MFHWKISAATQPLLVQWEELNNWAMTGDDMGRCFDEGAAGVRTNPWLVREPGTGYPASRTVGVEFVSCLSNKGANSFIGKVVKLPGTYKGRLKVGDKVLFDAANIAN